MSFTDKAIRFRQRLTLCGQIAKDVLGDDALALEVYDRIKGRPARARMRKASTRRPPGDPIGDIIRKSQPRGRAQ